MPDSIKSYLITNDSYYCRSMDASAATRFRLNFLHVCNAIRDTSYKNIDFACFRYNNASLLNAYEYDVLIAFIESCKQQYIEPIINITNNKLEILETLYKNGISIGVHFKELDLYMLDRYINSLKDLGNMLSIFYSAHSIDLASYAFNAGVDYATISPIYYDKGNKALGIDFLSNMPLHIKNKSFALGGVDTSDRIRQVSSCGLFGFASISYFSKYCQYYL